jgi:hypothetical protein
MFIVDNLLIGGLRFVLDKIVAAAETEMQDDTALREQLLEAEMRRELGEIDDAEFAAIEGDIVARLAEINAKQPGALTMSENQRIAGVEIETFLGENAADGGNGTTRPGRNSSSSAERAARERRPAPPRGR